MNELSFSITPVNKLLKLEGIVEVESGCSDGKIVELGEAKICSCSCGYVIVALGYEVCLAVPFFSFEHIFLVVDYHL